MSTSIDIRDLRSYTGQHLKPVLEAEARAWKERLLWDYSASIDLLQRYVDARILPGLLALIDGKPVGYCFSVYEGQKAVVGDVFAIPGKSATEVEVALVRSLLTTLQHTPGIDRIESQLLLHTGGQIATMFHNAGFTAYERIFMEAKLSANATYDVESYVLPPGLRLIRWSNSHFQIAGELIHRSYQQHGDSVINDQYHSIHGSLRFLHNIVRFPGCGVFDAEGSWVLWDERKSRMEGVLLCSTVDRGIAHLTQICIAPAYRGLGLGELLLRSAMNGLVRRGFQRITLTVTRANASAMRLYTNNGFGERLSFDAMVWERRT
ncbi:MAG: GNAT family N-acetyltransferase [Acidobacteria bacterium]|nr:GNAT family N-acetyltransferase [Acidobacteriota bacterium]